MTNLPSADYVALLSAGIFLLVGMLTGIWKYWHMMRSKDATAPTYVDICHRTALMYAFACTVLQQLALHSSWSAGVNLAAVAIPILWFASAVFTYAVHGWLKDTDNQLRRPHRLGGITISGNIIRTYMLMLILGEIGGTAILVAGVLV
jgi:hypothetical protein